MKNETIICLIFHKKTEFKVSSVVIFIKKQGQLRYLTSTARGQTIQCNSDLVGPIRHAPKLPTKHFLVSSLVSAQTSHKDEAP